MTRMESGLVAGFAFGALTVATMLPLAFPDKRAALIGAFINRFAIGFLIPLVELPLPGWGAGLAIGLLLSLSPAIITKAFAPILGLGTVGGALIGFLTRTTTVL
jgi:hypothetical protein